MATGEALPTLRPRTLERFAFPDGTHRFADHRSLAVEVPHSVSFDLVVVAWMACAEFDDDFLYSERRGAGPVHGSYRVNAITLESYRPLTSVEAGDALDAWLTEHDDPDWGPAGNTLADILYAKYRSGRPEVTVWLDERRQLFDLGDVRMLPPPTSEQEHEYGFCIWEFTEWLIWIPEDKLLHILTVGLD